MKVLGALFAMLAIILMVGCGDESGDSSGASSKPTTADETTTDPSSGETKTRTQTTVVTPAKPVPNKKTRNPKTEAAKFTGQDRENYKIAKLVCGAFPRKKVARDLGITTTDPGTIALKYAADYRPINRQATFEGCLAGLKD